MPPTTPDRLLDATYECVAEVGLSRLALEDVAAAAGVSRQTLYRHFGSREGLVEALVLREEQWFVEQVRLAASAAQDAEGAIAAGFTAAVHAAGEHPLLRRLLRTEPGEILPLVVLGRGPVISVARPVIAEVLTGHVDLPEEEIEILTDVCARLLISYVLDPGDQDPVLLGQRVAGLLLRASHRNDLGGA